ncbi:MAG: type II toxin-antitoxin system VapC family toxin [Terrimicrobiaceae bacterium]
MRTAIDTSVILAIWGKETGFERWERALKSGAEEGELCICPVVFAEISPGFDSTAVLLAALGSLAISYDDINPDSARLAGLIHQRYRQEGGLRQHLIPDFLIAAHAQRQCARLAAIDRGYLRRYFPSLTLLDPS